MTYTRDKSVEYVAAFLFLFFLNDLAWLVSNLPILSSRNDTSILKLFCVSLRTLTQT